MSTLAERATKLGLYDADLHQIFDRIEALEKALADPDCKTCANRGRVDGLSQETHCDHCIYQEKWRTDHYRREDL